MPDQYGMPLISDVSMPTLGYAPPSVDDVLQQRIREQQQQEMQQREEELRIQAQNRPPIQQQQGSQFVDWPTYQKLRSDVEPAEAYQDYVTKVAPNQLVAMGATPDQVKQTLALFQQKYPAPKQPEEPGILGVAKRAVGAVGSEIGDIARGTMANVGLARGAMGNTQPLAELAKEQAGEQPASESQARFREERKNGFFQAVANNPEGALDSALQMVVGFLPFAATGLVTGGVSLAAAGVGGLTALDLSLGSEALSQIREGAQADGVDINDTAAVSKWLKDGGLKQVFGKAIGPAATGAAITALAFGAGGKLGNQVVQTLEKSGTALTAGDAATAAALRARARGLKAAEIGATAGGFTAAGVAEDLVAGREVDEQSAWGNALLMLGLGALHARSPFKAADQARLAKAAEQPAKKETEQPPKNEEELTEEEAATLAAELKAAKQPPKATTPEAKIEGEAAKAEAAAAEVMPTEAEIQKTVEKAVKQPTKGVTTEVEDILKQVDAGDVPAFMTNRLKAVAKANGIDVGPNDTPNDVIDKLRAKRDEQPEPVTAEQLEALKSFADEDKAVAVSVVQQAEKEALSEYIQEVVAQVKTERKGRPGTLTVNRPQEEAAAAVERGLPSVEPPAEERPAAAVESAAESAVAAATEPGATPPAERPVGPVANAEVQQGGGGEVGERPVGGGRADVAEEGIHPTTPLKSRGRRPARGAGAGGKQPTAEQVVPLKRAGGEERGTGVTSLKVKTPLQRKIEDFVAAVKDRHELEAIGQDILDRMEEEGISPAATATRFWNSTYKKLPVDLQKKFDALLRSHNGNTEGFDLPSDVMHLEGTDRGFVALMQSANELGEKGLSSLVYKERPTKQEATTTKLEKKSPFKLPREEDFEPEPLSDFERAGLIGWRGEDGELDLPGVTPPSLHDIQARHILGGANEIVMPDAIHTDIKAGRATADRALESIGKSSASPLTRVLSHALRLALRGYEIPIEFRSGMRSREGDFPVAGRLDRTNNKIYLDPETGTNIRTLVHELTHAVTHRAIDYASTPAMFKAREELNAMFNRAKVAMHGEGEFANAFKDLHEFVSEAFSNPAFQVRLSKLPWDRSPFARERTVWDSMKQTVSNLLAKLLPGREQSVLFNALSQSMDLFEVPKQEVVKPTKEHLDQIAAQNVQTARDNVREGVGHIIGTKGPVTTHRAFERGENKYDLYDVTSGGDPRGDPASLRKGLTEDEVFKAIKEAGAEAEDRRPVGFLATPGNNRNMVSRWKGDKLVYVAVKDDEGVWHAQTSENLRVDARTAPRSYATPGSRAEAVRNADALSPHESLKASQEAGQIQERRDLLTKEGKSNVVVPGEPSDISILLTDRERPLIFTASAVDAWLKKVGMNAPPGMQFLSEWLLKNSNIGREVQRMIHDRVMPLMQKTRAVMKASKLLSGKSGYDTLDKVASALTVEHRSPKILPAYERGGMRYVDNDPLKGETPEYKQVLKNIKDAKDYLNGLDNLEPGLRKQVYDVMREWKQFSDWTLDTKQKYGLMDALTVAKIKRAYDIYAPLREEGKVTKTSATGQSAFGKDIFARIAEQGVDAIMRGVDNQAINTLRFWARIADIQNPDGSKIFKIDPVDREHLVRDPVTGEVKVSTVINPSKSIIFYEDGRPMRMEINNDKILKALQHLQAPERDLVIRKALGVAGFYTRLFATLHTSLSPAFAPRNFIRDYFQNVSQLDRRISYKTFHAAMMSPAVWGAAFRHGYREAAKLAGKDTMSGNSAAAKLARDVDQYRPLIERQHQYGTEQINYTPSTSLKPSIRGKISEYAAPADGKLTNFLSGLTHTLEAVNRIAVFVAARKTGLTGEEAAMLAKNATVNFERHGSMSPFISPMYAFANAKLQGMRTLGEGLGFSPLKGAGTGSARQAMMGLLPGTRKAESANMRTINAARTAIALGLGAAYVNYKDSEKDKDGRTMYGKRSEYQLDEYLHIPGLNIDLPIPQEIGSFYNVGSTMGDALWGDRAGAASTPLVRFVTAMIQNFWPGGTSMHDPIGTKGEGGDYFARLVMPTPFISLYDNTVNMDSFGRTINKLKGSNVPPEMQGAATSSPFARATTKGMHDVGLMDASPKAVDHFLKGLFQQQKGVTNAITDGNISALLDETFKSFHQKVFPGTNANDYEQISRDVRMEAQREKGAPLKRGDRKTELVKLFEDTDNKIKGLTSRWSKTTDEEVKKRIDEQQNELRLKALKRYYEERGVTH